MQSCGECGFAYDEAAAEAVGPHIVAAAAEIAAVLTADGDLATRREPAVWSPLEYACHVRDALLAQRERLLVMRREELPEASLMGRDERVEHEGYAEQDPTDVARQVGDAAALVANVIGRIGPDDWERRIVFQYPVRAERTMRFVAVFTLHEVRHHLMDMRRQLP